MDEQVFGQSVIEFLADEHCQSVNHIDEYIVLQHDCRDAVAHFKLHALVYAEALRKHHYRIDDQNNGKKDAECQRSAGKLQGAPPTCLHHEKFAVSDSTLKNPYDSNKSADGDGNRQPQRNDSHRHQKKIRDRRAAVDNHFQKPDGLKQPHDADQRDGHRDRGADHLPK